MGDVSERLNEIRGCGVKGIIPYIVAGYPSLSASMELLLALGEQGATAIEVGIPFSDPMADGPVIQEAHAHALREGVTPISILEALDQLKGKVNMPLILMTYYNLVFRMGEEAFAQMAKGAGVAGAIIPDLPPEEAGDWIEAANVEGLDTIFLVAPNTLPDRIETIASVTSGFLYYLALKGVTGSPIEDLQAVVRGLDRVRKVTNKPLCVGFGISSQQEVSQLSPHCDGLIVGSSLLRALKDKGINGAISFFRALVEALLIPQ